MGLRLHVLYLGKMEFPKFRLVDWKDENEMVVSPAVSLLIQHPTLGNILYDTGNSEHFAALYSEEMLHNYPVTECITIEEALAEKGLKPEDIDYINAHGTSTPLNDRTETAAVKLAFGEHAHHLAMSSTKSNTGHLLGASGAIEAIITLKALEENYIPPTINYAKPDADCDLDIVANEGREADLRYAMSNSLGFGGHNASLVFAKWEE